MYIAFCTAGGLLAGLIVGFWFGHYVGWTDFQRKFGADLSHWDWLRLPPERKLELTHNVVWTYRHILQREPSPREISNWEKNNWPLEQVITAFMASDEFKAMPEGKQKAAHAAVKRHFGGKRR